MTSSGKEVFLPSSAEVELAKSSMSKLSKVLSKQPLSGAVTFTVVINNGEKIDITPGAARALLDATDFIAQGKAVVVNSIGKVLETQEAADILNVSRPYLCKLLDSGEIQSHKVGRFRRVEYEDLLAYKSRRIAKQNTAMDELAAQAQELNMGY
jgi:excisionase family DNA binding protein